MLSLAQQPEGAVPEAAPYVIVELRGQPRGKGDQDTRIAKSRAGKLFVLRYIDKPTRVYMAALAKEARIAMALAGKPMLHGAVAVGIIATMRVPVSWPERDRIKALTGAMPPTSKPDWDNIGKMLDAFKGIVWGDDAAVAQAMVVKEYGERPALRVEVFRLLARTPLFELGATDEARAAAVS